MSANPFDDINHQLAEIKELLRNSPLNNSNTGQDHPGKEIIDTTTLCARLGITEPTAIRHRKRGKIPFLQIGSSIRYDWAAVVKALEHNDKLKTQR